MLLAGSLGCLALDERRRQRSAATAHCPRAAPASAQLLRASRSLAGSVTPAALQPTAAPRSVACRAGSRADAAATSAQMPANLRKIVFAFQAVPDPMQRYKQLLFFASKLKPLAAELHVPENKVEGCVSQVCHAVVQCMLSTSGHALRSHACIRYCTTTHVFFLKY